MFCRKKILLILSLVWVHSAYPQTSAQKLQKSTYSFGVKIFGQGKPVILIPGLRGDGEATYATTISHYRKDYTCYVITLAGFAGQPPSDSQEGVLLRQRDELLQYIRDNKLNKPALIGFSFGGVLALWMASHDPALFGPVVDIDGAPYESSFGLSSINNDSLKKETAAELAQMNKATPATIALYDSLRHTPQEERYGFEFLKSMIEDTTQIPQVLEWDKKSDYLATNRMSMEMTVLNLQDSVASISSPLLVLGSWTGDPTFTSRAQAEAAMKKQFARTPNVTIVYSEHGKHFLMWNDFSWMTSQIDNFFRKYHF
jgi:N-formylmaleamate deformylase